MKAQYYVEASRNQDGSISLRQVSIRDGKRKDETKTLTEDEARALLKHSIEWIANMQETVDALESVL